MNQTREQLMSKAFFNMPSLTDSQLHMVVGFCRGMKKSGQEYAGDPKTPLLQDILKRLPAMNPEDLEKTLQQIKEANV